MSDLERTGASDTGHSESEPEWHSFQHGVYTHASSVLLISGAVLGTILAVEPSIVACVLLLTVIRLYTHILLSRPHRLRHGVLLLAFLALSNAIGHGGPSMNALSSTATSLVMLTGVSIVFAFLALIPAVIETCWRVRLPSSAAQILFFPALWATTWSAWSSISPVGRLLVWSPVPSTGPYAWLRPVVGEVGVDWIVASWAVVVSNYIGDWLMEPASVGDDGMESSQQPRRQSISSRQGVVTGFLVLLMIPSLYYRPSSFPVQYSSEITPLTVACALPLGAHGEQPTFADYISATKQLLSASDIILWPENAVRFHTSIERSIALESIQNLTKLKNNLLIGVSFQDSIPSEQSQRNDVGRNTLLVMGRDGPVLEYHKRMLVPFVESFSLASSYDPPAVYHWSMAPPKSLPKLTPPRNMSITASICLDFSSPNSFDELPTRPDLILGPARTWHPDVSKAMWDQALARAEEVGSTILWCDGGLDSFSGVVGSSVGMREPQQRGPGSWARTIGLPYPSDERRTITNALQGNGRGDWLLVLFAWILVVGGAGIEGRGDTPIFRNAIDWGRDRLTSLRARVQHAGAPERTGERQRLLIDLEQ